MNLCHYWIRLRVWWLRRGAERLLAEVEECHEIERAALKSARQCWTRAMRLRARAMLLQGLLP